MKLMRRDPDRGYLDTGLWVPKALVNVQGVKNTLTFELFDQEEVRYLELFEETEHHLIVPRALWDLTAFPNIQWVDLRPTHYRRTGIKSRVLLDHKPRNGVLTPTGKTTQRDAIRALLGVRGGTLQLKCGAGKTPVALHLAALMQVPTLVAVDNTHLIHQWQEAIGQFLEVPGGVGLIQGSTKEWRHGIVIATYHTLANWADTMPEEIRRWFGLFIAEEGHHANAPTFSRAAPLFYGYRLSLTATPERSDGSHVICLYHVGPVVFKDIRQETPPAIYFRWTGLRLDDKDIRVLAAVNDKSGELHLGKLAGYLGGWRTRLAFILREFRNAVQEGRKVLVLSNSVNEVANLMALWEDENAQLFTDIPYPLPKDIGEALEPLELNPKKQARHEELIRSIQANLRGNQNLPQIKRQNYQAKIDSLKEELERYRVFRALENEYGRRQRTYIKDIVARSRQAGLFTYGVPAAERMRMLRGRKIIFAIMKYGKEGLDDAGLDTVYMCEPVSDKNTIQQIMGRPRDKQNGKLVIFEDDIGPLIGQCNKLRKHFREWAVDEGGPFRYTLEGHPATFRRKPGQFRSIQVPSES